MKLNNNMDNLDPKTTYTATIVLSSIGDEDTVTLDGVFFAPDISDEDIDNGDVPWSYRIASYMIKNLKKDILELNEDNVAYPTSSRSIM